MGEIEDPTKVIVYTVQTVYFFFKYLHTVQPLEGLTYRWIE